MFQKDSYLIGKDKIMIYSSYGEFYSVVFMKNYSVSSIYYGFTGKDNIRFDNFIMVLAPYIGKWEQDDGSLYKFLEFKLNDNKLYIDMEVDIDNSIAMFYTNEGFIDFDLNTIRFKVKAVEQGGDQLTDCYYRFYKYNNYLVAVDYNQKDDKCVYNTPFNMSGVYKVSYNNN